MLEKIRAVILYLLAGLIFVIGASIYIPLIFLFEPHKSTWFRLLYAKAVISAAFCKLIIINQPPINQGPYLFICNHQSMFDGFMLGAALPYHFSAVGKKEAFSIPIFGLIIRQLGIISIDRKNHENSMAGISEAVEKIKSGIPVIIFPEGTRTKDGLVSSFKKGAFRLALDSQAIIVPVGISGSYDAQPADSWLLWPGVLKINFGQPISYGDYQNLSVIKLSDQIRDQIIELSSNP